MSNLFTNSFSPADLVDVLLGIVNVLKSNDKPGRGKGYWLSKIPSKKNGFTYYVRYMDNGVQVPSRWTTGTNDPIEARNWAILNKERLLADYYKRLAVPKTVSMFSVLKNYYKLGSVSLERERKRGRELTDRTAGKYYRFINKKLIPFLTRYNIKNYADITPPILVKLQNYLLKDRIVKGKHIDGNKPQTVNYFMSCVKTIFDNLVLDGTIKDNIFDKIQPLKVPQNKRGNTGCYVIDDVKGVFNKRWTDKKLYLLNLLIYTTNMRNSEIERIKREDLTTINKINYLQINESKTENGIRLVPLHPFVYQKLKQYAGTVQGDYIFSNGGKPNQSELYKAAYMTLGTMMGKTEEYIEKENIKFYSGRAWWKTTMDAADLGDVEEYFMGHKVTSDVSKRYNHKDKQGKDMLVKKAKEIFKILDKKLFTFSKHIEE